MKNNKLLLSFMLGVLCWTTAGATRAAETIQAVYEAARKEGKVVVWSSLDVATNQGVAAKFAAKYPGITVEPFKILADTAVERLLTEAQAGRVNADIIDPNVSYFAQLFERNLIEPYPWDEVFGVPANLLLYDKRALLISHYDIPIAYNTDLARPVDVKSWNDILDPKWRGKIVLESHGYPIAFLATKWGMEEASVFLAKLLENKPIIVQGPTAAAEALTSGQGALAVGVMAPRVLLFKDGGAPIEWARVGPVPSFQVAIAPIKGAPHPNAAKLWAAFWSTPEAQAVMYEKQRYGLVAGAPLSPHGEDIRKAGLEVVFEDNDFKRGAQALESVSKQIRGNR